MTDRTPLRRWLTEAAVIVGSILLAFAIDAWWQEMQESSETRIIRESLTEEFRWNADAARSTVELHRERQDALGQLVELDVEELRALGPEAWQDLVRVLVYPSAFDPEMGTLDALVASGSLNRLDDPRLRGALTRYAQRLADTDEESRLMWDSAVRVWEAMAERGGPWAMNLPPITVWSEPTPDVLIELIADEDFMGLVRYHLGISQMYAADLAETVEVAEAVLGFLEG